MLALFSNIKLIAAAAVLLALAGSMAVAKHEYDQAHALSERVAAQEAQIATIRQDAAANEAALVAQAEEARVRAAKAATTNRRIASAPRTSACAGSPAIGALLDGLRHGPAPNAASGSGGFAHLR